MSFDHPKESFAALFEETSKTLPRARGLRIGETFDGLVVQVGKDAIIVELAGHRQGFVELDELRGPDGTLKVALGDVVRVRVTHVDPEQGVRLAPTREAVLAAGASVEVGNSSEPVAVKVAMGQVVSGTVERVESYGIFMQMDGTNGRAGRGLLPTAELGLPRGADLRKAFPLGMKLQAKIIEMREGKMRMSLRAMKADEERAQFDGFREENKSATAQGFGTLGDLLKSSRPR